MDDEMRTELLQGTLDLLILKTLASAPMHGWGIAQRLAQISAQAIQVPQGSLYPALRRLERQGLVRAKWALSENNRRARFYELTRTGRLRLGDEEAAWHRFAQTVALILEAT
jgi:PadR family transcriptional regulator PadR